MSRMAFLPVSSLAYTFTRPERMMYIESPALLSVASSCVVAVDGIGAGLFFVWAAV